MPLTPQQREKRIKEDLPLPTAKDIKEFVLAAAEDDISAMQSYIDVFGPECIDEFYGATTALMNAAHFGGLKSVRFLLDNGADPNCTNLHGMTPAMHTVFNDGAGKLDLLLHHGTPLNAVTEQGMTLLIMAAWHNAQNCVSLLLEKGADMTIVDKEGLDATDRALCEDNHDVVLLLENHRHKRIRDAHQEKLKLISTSLLNGLPAQKNKPQVKRKPGKPPAIR